MAFIGIGRKKLSTEAIGSKCPSCGSDEMMMVDIYARYFALLWIPFFPAGKDVKATCPKCGHKPELHTLPTSFFLETEQMKNMTSSPGYLFSGLFIFLLAAVFFVFRFIDSGSKPGQDDFADYLNSPESGDVYEIKTDNGNYSLLKIVDVKDDSVYVKFHVEEKESQSEIKMLSTDKNFARDVFAFSMEQIKQNYDDGLILNIQRSKTEEEKPETSVGEEKASNRKEGVQPSEAPKRNRTNTSRTANSAK
ncbi:MAG: hypothetical protein IPM56_17455 [Ignavibacteriales bacterium]|nr:MAG: hypothetical protein IPM56_17455 [Ignavibacteriales bacterium]